MSDNSQSTMKTREDTGTSSKWTICKSKNHGNRNYYFNSATGESVWDLSEAKKSKAVKQTTEECPEPTEPHVVRSTRLISNKQRQVIINTMRENAEQPPGTVAPHYISVNGIPQYSTIAEKKVVWDRPPPLPNFTVPLPMVRPSLTKANNANLKDITIPTTTPLTERFAKLKSQESEDMKKREEQIVNKSVEPTIRPMLKPGIRLNDLRVKLTAKRLLESNIRSNDYFEEAENVRGNMPKIYETSIERGMGQLNVKDNVDRRPENYENITVTNPVTPNENGLPTADTHKDQCEDDEMWLNKYAFIENEKWQVDVSPLKALRPSGFDKDCWFILADTNVYFVNLEFLRVLIDSDDQCFLLVTQTVIKELEYAAVAPGASKRLEGVVEDALALIVQLLDSGRAKTDEDVLSTFPGYEGCPLGDDHIVQSCLRIAQSNYHVILLTNDKLLERKSTSTLINMFTVEKVKSLLARYLLEKEQQNISVSDIFITINNRNDDISNDTLVSPDSITNNIMSEEDTTEMSPSTSYNIYDKILKKTSHNDFRCVPNEIVPNNNLDLETPTYLPTSPETIPMDIDTATTSQSTSMTSESKKKRVIRLNRNTEPHRSPRIEKKLPVKWRRRPLSKENPENPQSQQTKADGPAKLPHINDANPMPQEQEIHQKLKTIRDTFKAHSKLSPTNLENRQKIPNILSPKSRHVKAQAKLAPKTLCNSMTQESNQIKVSDTVSPKSQDIKVQTKLASKNLGHDTKMKERDIHAVSHKSQHINAQTKLPFKTLSNASTTKERNIHQKVLNTVSPKTQQIEAQTKVPPKNLGIGIMTQKREIHQIVSDISPKSQNMTARTKLSNRVTQEQVLPKTQTKVIRTTRPNGINPTTLDQQSRQKLAAIIEKNQSPAVENEEVASSIGNTSCSSILNVTDLSAQRIVEETSMSSSDVIPNSISSINSDGPKLNLSNYSRGKRISNTIVAEAMDKTMLDYLSTGSEAWVSCFVQIMEEALTQVLMYHKMEIQEGTFLPFDIYEATELIKTRFRHINEIYKSVNNFSQLLLRVKDSRGHIQFDLTPEVFMNIFGAGNNLLQNLQKVSAECEDIKGSLELLDNLLKDIRAPRTFNDSLPPCGNAYDRLCTPDHFENRISPPVSKGNSYQEETLQSPYSPNKNQDNKTISETKFIRIAPKDYKIPKKAKAQLKQLTNDFEKKQMVKSDNNDSEKLGPKMMFKFSAVPQFEERLKAKDQDMYDKLNFSVEEFDEKMDYEYESDWEQEESFNEEELQDQQVEHTGFEIMQEGNHEIENLEGATDMQSHRKENLASYIKLFVKEIKDTLIYVTTFCEDTFAELSSDDVSVSRSLEIEAQAKDTYNLMETLLGNLNSILERESNDTENNMKSIVQNSFPGLQVSSYRDVIHKCADQSKILLQALSSFKNLNNNLNLGV